MIVLSHDFPVVHPVRSWSDEDWQRRMTGATEGQRAFDSHRDGRDQARQPMNLCERCLAISRGEASPAGATGGAR